MSAVVQVAYSTSAGPVRIAAVHIEAARIEAEWRSIVVARIVAALGEDIGCLETDSQVTGEISRLELDLRRPGVATHRLPEAEQDSIQEW